MRNLKLQYRKTFNVVPDAKCILLNPNTGDSNLIYFTTECKIYSYNTVSLRTEEVLEVPGIVSCDYLALENQISVATDVGEVLLVNPQTKSVEEGTFCDEGLMCMAWSPDQEVVVVITKQYNVVVMTHTYDVLADHPLADQSFGENEFITLGWGKKETQFHGSEGKSAAKQTNTFQKPDHVETLPKDVEITWRADCAYFAVSYVNDRTGRAFKVFDKEGIQKYSSENLSDLFPPLAWRPSGTWLAMPHRLPNKSTIALFEKNGLRHREIILPFGVDQEPVHSLNWSLDSDILCVETRNKETNQNNLYLYTIGNYHWYLKQVLTFSLEDPISAIVWDNRIGEEKTMHLILKSGQYSIYRWHFSIDKHDGTVAVIDGKKLLLTDFSHAIVPPPMCSTPLEMETNINACGFYESNKDELLLYVYDEKTNLNIFKISTLNPMKVDKLSTLKADTSLEGLSFNNFIWYNSRLIIGYISVSNKTTIYAIDCNDEVYTMKSSLQVNDTIIAITKGRDNFFIHTTDGMVRTIVFHEDFTRMSEKLYAELPKGPADHMEWFTLEHVDPSCLISLRTNQFLFINSQCISADVTSFCIAGNYLVFTKLTTLYFLRISDKRIVSERKIERGGKLITSVSKNARIVLQLPRGNLEAICPRVLTLEIVARHLDQKQYNAAMDILRKNRINLNIICDHNMVSFVENLPIFLEEIKNPSWLNVFLSDLRNEDVTQTMYTSNYKEGSQIYPTDFKIENKVFYLCEKLCALMEKGSESNYRFPIITAYVKIDKVEKALDIIWQERQRENALCMENKSSEEALKYLLYLVDVNQLYNYALGTYDFGLVLFVAQKSQKDPKEYLPFLNELKSLELNYRKFKIDEYLKRYESALYNIAQCGKAKLNEALEFIKLHKLFHIALQCYQGQSECYQEICLAFADHLRENGNFENASIMYERGNNLSQAILSAKHVLDWQRALVLAKKDGQSIENLILSLVSSLQENEKYGEAFELLKTYGNDFSAAVNCLLQGKLFLRAIFEMRMHENNDSPIDSLITPNLLTYKDTLLSQISADQKLFLGYKNRLLELREIKEKSKHLISGEDHFEDHSNIDECDLLSDTTSINSSRHTNSSRGSTGKTFRSSKNRRKHERKLLSLKPGNPFEDIAIIDALYNLIMRVVGQQLHVRDTCKALIELQQDEAARKLQHQFKSLLTIIQESLDEIWIPEMMSTQTVLTGPNIDYTQLKNNERYAMIDSQKRFKPQLTIINWQHPILG